VLQEIIVIDVGGGVHTIGRELAPHCSYIHSSRICGSACGRGLLAGSVRSDHQHCPFAGILDAYPFA
jgi:hypothetical protein